MHRTPGLVGAVLEAHIAVKEALGRLHSQQPIFGPAADVELSIAKAGIAIRQAFIRTCTVDSANCVYLIANPAQANPAQVEVDEKKRGSEENGQPIEPCILYTIRSISHDCMQVKRHCSLSEWRYIKLVLDNIEVGVEDEDDEEEEMEEEANKEDLCLLHLFEEDIDRAVEDCDAAVDDIDAAA
eukprot:3897078-Amphidinium_carterae.1